VVPAVAAGCCSRAAVGVATGSRATSRAMDPAPWAARLDMAVADESLRLSLPASVMGGGVGGLLGGSVDWGGHVLHQRWSATLGWFGEPRSIFQSQLRVREA
jgi:hypothetical protein